MTDLSHPPSSTKEDTPSTTLLNSKAAIPQESYDQGVKTASLLDVVVPTERDILCCRGLTATEHPGNVLFRAIVRTYIPRYSSLFGCNAAASLLYWEITQTLQREHGARFLRKRGDVWGIVDDEEARRKTAREVRKQQKLQEQREAQKAKKEEEEQTMKLSSAGNKIPSSRAVDKTIRKKPRGSLWSFNAEISRIMGEESDEEDEEKQGRGGTSNKSTTTSTAPAASMTFRGHQDHQHAREEQEQEQQEDGREADGATASTSSSSTSSGGGSSDHEHEKRHPSNIMMKPLPTNHKKNNKKQQLFLKPHSVGEAPASRGVSMVLEAVEQVPPSSRSPASSGRRNFLLALVSQNLPPEDEGHEYSFSTRRQMMVTGSPQHQQHFLRSGPSPTYYIGDDAYDHSYCQIDNNMNGLHHVSRILQGERGGEGWGVSSTTVLSPRPAAATSYYQHDQHHDECQDDDDRKAPSLRSENVPSSSSAARGRDHNPHHHLQGKQEQYIDERLPVVDFFLE